MSGEARDTRDRSVPRRRVRDGETARDRRGRLVGAPAVLHYGFRPFFLLASIYAGLAIPAWLWMHYAGYAPDGVFAGMSWHAHEMLFGYLAAVIAGFILTAVPNWTGRLPLSGTPLAILVAFWLTGRLATAFGSDPLVVLAADLAFPAALAGAVWREVIAGRNWKNAPIAGMLTLFGAANALHHAEAAFLIPAGSGTRLALAVIALLMALIGGRIVPSFTRNWLVRTAKATPPASPGAPDTAALLASAASLALWIFLPDDEITGLALVLAAALLITRLSRWQGWHTRGEPILFILHVGYGWLAAAFALLAASILAPAHVPGSAAIHALTAGAAGTMTLAVMTRATLGHTGRAINADLWTTAIYVAVTIGALLRVASPFAGDLQSYVLAGGGAFWSLAFLIFALRYGPFLLRPRL
jgi:uncharacterized protein involved in response to NO